MKLGVSAVVLALIGISTAHAQDEVDYWSGVYGGIYAGGMVSYAGGAVQLTPGNSSFTSGATQNGIDADGYKSVASLMPEAGGQLGYNYLLNDVLLGGELSFGYFNPKETKVITSNLAGFPSRNYVANARINSDWLLTFRPRLGYALGDVLIEGSGGIALADLTVQEYYSDNYQGGRSVFGKTSTIKLGWTAGTAVSYALDTSWSVKGEYLFTSFGRIYASGPVVDRQTVTTGVMSQSYALGSHTLKLALNYLF